MFLPVATNDPAAVEAAVQAAYLEMFPAGDGRFVPRIFGWVSDCFTGRYADYQAIDARYHDFEHTLQGTLCMARLLSRRHSAGAQPPLPQRMVELGLLAILLHDTGYLKRRDDIEGTGAKYTVTHVNRSAEFAALLLGEKGFPANVIKAVQHLIRCTGVDATLTSIPFESEAEKITGFALGTADLLGQMAAADYVEKLPVLYAEFAEAARHSPPKNSMVGTFTSAQNLMQKTPAFWEIFVKPRLERDFGGVFRFLNDPYPDGPNDYLKRIEANIRRLRQRLSSDTTTFLRKSATT
jgi:hypothetical protein